MKRLSTYDWRRNCRTACIVLAAGAVFCLYRLSGSEFASRGTILFWFIALMVCVGLFMPCIIGFYYFRVKDANWDAKHEAIAVLGSTAQSQSGKNGKNTVK